MSLYTYYQIVATFHLKSHHLLLFFFQIGMEAYESTQSTPYLKTQKTPPFSQVCISHTSVRRGLTGLRIRLRLSHDSISQLLPIVFKCSLKCRLTNIWITHSGHLPLCHGALIGIAQPSLSFLCCNKVLPDGKLNQCAVSSSQSRRLDFVTMAAGGGGRGRPHRNSHIKVL